MEEGLPVVDLPMSEKAGILADMIDDCRNKSADVELFVLARLLALHALIWVFENCQSVTVIYVFNTLVTVDSHAAESA